MRGTGGGQEKETEMKECGRFCVLLDVYVTERSGIGLCFEIRIGTERGLYGRRKIGCDGGWFGGRQG